MQFSGMLQNYTLGTARWGFYMLQSTVMNARVSRRVLWVGSEAYPLHSIARAQAVKLVPKRGAALGHYLKVMLPLVLLGVAAAVALRLAPRVNSVQGYNVAHGVAVGVLVLAAVLALVSTARLITRLSQQILYALVIETAGNPRTALVSPDERVVTELVQQIMDAIDNPDADFPPIQVLDFGDKINQYGQINVGKVSR